MHISRGEKYKHPEHIKTHKTSFKEHYKAMSQRQSYVRMQKVAWWDLVQQKSKICLVVNDVLQIWWCTDASKQLQASA